MKKHIALFVTLLAVLGLGTAHAGMSSELQCTPGGVSSGATDSGEWVFVPEDH